MLEVLSDCYKVSMLGSLPGDYNVICFRCGPGICWGKQLRTKPTVSKFYFVFQLPSNVPYCRSEQSLLVCSGDQGWGRVSSNFQEDQGPLAEPA